MWSKKTADEMFEAIGSFSQRNLGPVKAVGNARALGDIIGFDMKSWIHDIGQGYFEVKVTQFDTQRRSVVVRTLAGHPLAGWRYWGVKKLPDGDLLIETFSVEHPVTWIDTSKLFIGGLKGMYDTWTTELFDLLAFSGGIEVKAQDSIPFGEKKHQVFTYYETVYGGD